MMKVSRGLTALCFLWCCIGLWGQGFENTEQQSLGSRLAFPYSSATPVAGNPPEKSQALTGVDWPPVQRRANPKRGKKPVYRVAQNPARDAGSLLAGKLAWRKDDFSYYFADLAMEKEGQPGYARLVYMIYKAVGGFILFTEGAVLSVYYWLSALCELMVDMLKNLLQIWLCLGCIAVVAFLIFSGTNAFIYLLQIIMPAPRR